ncbi:MULTISPECIES: NADH ubiquinone dehydrogenase [Desulfococcus]|jgi:NAD-reducing hydrogenase small subunit|uniref:NADH ubiquinone oxidoreductase 20 kDa subunit n=1 Tax=Desulfococcus multivorans DSM 2059 TaxID=1121405 RepID=S7V5F0_DESML|nr:NADH ubiquinone dehydrogenase [Desulfococcus multivorans]AOY56868.1 NADH-ubiquinone oxidoreductase, 20 kDa subunit [Desulfococcus multivorans]AQU99409.1 NADP oxidoreductase [Desulfococcus multivorans]EPR41884.1 NADH ubiquinone oxidoreductase 20 kDa subunit [Desulfococcus multivorans DSM 2059]SJZ93821.1 NAD(P)-dependent nickel-iron dehydrogenase subunit HoxY [Desulfococcus multivorans DSM 2059]
MDLNRTARIRLATAWLGGCSGCHMSFLDLDERLIEVFEAVDLVYSPLMDIKTFPLNVDVTLVEGAVVNTDHLRDARRIRENSRMVASFGDCAVTGNVPAMRNRLDARRLVAEVYAEGPGEAPPGGHSSETLPRLLPRVLPLHQVISVDAFLPGCPPGRERIWTALDALLKGKPIVLPEEMRTFG